MLLRIPSISEATISDFVNIPSISEFRMMNSERRVDVWVRPFAQNLYFHYRWLRRDVRCIFEM
jgi:hypothetical protein